MCAIVHFFITMLTLWCWEPAIGKRPTPLFFSSPSFSLPLWFTRPSHTSSKGLPDTPLSEVPSPTAPNSPHSVHIGKGTFLQDLTLSILSASLEKRMQKRGAKKRGGKRSRVRGGEADRVIAAHHQREGERAREQSFGGPPASATIQLLCRELT